ncbi:putative polyprotein [Pelargonium vein banding virus]|uniref:putative polyprotein n=1 Tax=Pelargonium vein banding virus TaxID=671126 RepID=UPI0001B7202B|nr:putative polyprotein [Pelargonium vein banding virus]ACV74337.1 putative polyprotein [Pelargonium vein banding virus]
MPEAAAPAAYAANWPKGAVLYNGVNFLAADGKTVILSDAAKRIKAGVAYLRRKQRRWAKAQMRRAVCAANKARKAYYRLTASTPIIQVGDYGFAEPISKGFRYKGPGAPKKEPRTTSPAERRRRVGPKAQKEEKAQDWSVLDDGNFLASLWEPEDWACPCSPIAESPAQMGPISARTIQGPPKRPTTRESAQEPIEECCFMMRQGSTSSTLPPVRGSNTAAAPIQEDQVRDYRRWQRLRWNMRNRWNTTFRRTLESELDPEAEIQLSQRRRANMVPAEVLYEEGWSSTRLHRVYQHYSEERILSTGEQVELPFVTRRSYERLQRTGYQQIHLGLVLIRVHTLHRRDAGVKALVVFRDTRWRDDRSIIGSMEIDLSIGTQLAYIAPDMMMSIHDFYNHVEVVVATRGYEEWQGGESNLLITRGLVGRLTNTSHASFNYNVEQVAEHLSSHGIVALPGRRHSADAHNGEMWSIRPPRSNSVRNPREVQISNRLDGSVSLRFTGYEIAPAVTEALQSDDESELAAMAIQESGEDEDDDPFQDFLYMASMPRTAYESQPIWDDSDSEEEPDQGFINPFSEDGGGSKDFEAKTQTALMTSMEELPYPKLKKLEAAFSSGSVVSNYAPPQDSNMGPPTYPPAPTNGASSSRPMPTLGLEGARPKVSDFRRRETSNQWNLPSAQQVNGAMLVLPEDIGLYEEVISRWESITINLLNDRTWDNNKARVIYVENLLGESEKKIWQQWRTTYTKEYEELVAIADDPQDITSQVRMVITLEDPYRGSTEEQSRAYLDLERLVCDDIKDILPYLNDFKVLAAKSGRMFTSPELSEKLFRKLPPLIGGEIEAAFKEKYPGNTVGVLPRIVFIHHYLTDLCKKAAIQRGIKDLSFCRKFPIPGYYQKSQKKYGLRKSQSYKGKPHDTHVRVVKNKDKARSVKCKCFICGEEGHFARECRSKKGNIARAAVVDNLDLPPDFDVLSLDLNESDSDAICSFSEGEIANGARYVQEELHKLPYETALMLQSQNSWRRTVKLPAYQDCCGHQPTLGPNLTFEQAKCAFCGVQTNPEMRMYCDICRLTACPMCSKYYLDIPVRMNKPPPPPPENKDELIHELVVYTETLLKRVKELEEQLKEKELEIARLELMINDEGKQETAEEGEEANFIEESSTIHCEEDEFGASAAVTGRKVINRLYNVKILFTIPNVKPFTLNAIVDTGATSCCADIRAIPEEALEELNYTVNFFGVNSESQARHKIKGGQISMGESNFRLPFIYAFKMDSKDEIQMLLGCNFLRSMAGGVRLEGTTITFYKQITTINTTLAVESAKKAIPELDLDAEMLAEIQELVYYQSPARNPRFESRFEGLIGRLRNLGFIGENPVKHWARNQVKCRLEIINPDLTIQDKPLKHVTPQMEAQFKRHTDALLQLGVIRPSKSRHRTMAIMVQSGTTVDPATGKETRGKERMVYNYRSLNDNTHKDQYSLPGINTILKKIGTSKVYSKFDLKSGFHQVAMDEESIPWTAFCVPGGLYEWLVMPFGLKNAPSVFQRKMDDCFKGTEAFIAVYIDDILVFSKNEEEHQKHLQKFLEIVEKEGLVLSPTKMKIAVPEVEFLGAIIGNSTIKLQPHIIRKIADIPEEQLKEKKGLRGWLGILNYARTYIPNLSTLLGPLYQKTSPHGDKRLKAQDYALIRQIKALVQNLPDLKIPPADSYIVLETDGCMEGWGGVCKWKPNKHSPKSQEKVAAYASGKFPVVKSTIDAEIHACMGTLSALKIHYLDRKEITLRTDCQAIVSFHNKMAQNKPSRVRWISFTDFITGLGIKVNIEHIDGKDNVLADTLSRLIFKIQEEGALMALERRPEWEPRPPPRVDNNSPMNIIYGLIHQDQQELINRHKEALWQSTPKYEGPTGLMIPLNEAQEWRAFARRMRIAQAQKVDKELLGLLQMAQDKAQYIEDQRAGNNWATDAWPNYLEDVNVIHDVRRKIQNITRH